MPRGSDLERIVADYRRHHQADARYEQAWFGDAALPVEQSIRRAALSRVPRKRDGREILHSHQRRIGRERLVQAADALAGHGGSLAAARGFDDLLLLVGRAIGSRRGIGALAVYDVAHRIGMRLGHVPEYVYLHAGTRDGARALRLSWRVERLPLSAFDRELQVLVPAEIEDLLCLYKKELALIGAGKPLPSHIGASGCGRRVRGC